MKIMTLQEFAKLGGKAGRGKAKVRGNAEYYKAIAKKSVEVRKKKKEATKKD